MRNVVCFIMSGCMASAQGTRTGLRGSLTDSNGAVIPGAQVTITGPGFRQIALTGSEGTYVAGVPAGTYTVTVEAEHFGKTETAGVVVTAGRERNLDFALNPAPLEDEIVIATLSDAASLRPGFLPSPGVAPGAAFLASGRFGLTDTTGAGGEYPVEIDGLSLTIANTAGDSLQCSLASAGPNQVTGIIPDIAAPGLWSVTARRGEKVSRPRSFEVVWTPRIYSRNLLGFGLAEIADTSGTPVTYTNPMRPGLNYEMTIANAGSNADGYVLKIGNTTFARGALADAAYTPGPVPGAGVFRFGLPGSLPTDAYGCGVPIQIGAGPGVWSNQVTAPISREGPCSDALAFGAADFAQLTEPGIAINETQITEGSFLSSATPGSTRNFTFGRMLAARWRIGAYGPPPPSGSCAYRWEPAGFVNPEPPQRLSLGGAASMTVPWGQFNFAPNSNNGPFSLAFAPPAAFSEGTYALDYPSTFTVDGRNHTFRASGSYQRRAGAMRNFFVNRLAALTSLTSDGIVGLAADLDGLEATADANVLRQLIADLTVTVDHGTLGRHSVRCLSNGDAPLDLGARLESILPLLPARANNVDVTLRWFPIERVRHDHTSGVLDRSLVSFDAFVAIQDLPAIR